MVRTSVIIAAHNEGLSLRKTVQSCIETSAGLDYEIIVTDDASNDRSIEEVERCFTQVRIHRHAKRQGAAQTKADGARAARGQVLVFLDAHTKPEGNAILQLVRDVEDLNGEAIVTPAVPSLDTEEWKNDTDLIGHGYGMDLLDLSCYWLDLYQMQKIMDIGRPMYETPALIGCALAVSRQLYEEIRGFDPYMRSWGIEDLDFGLRCWLLGNRILHDPEVHIGHRFRDSFDNYAVPVVDVISNQIRMAYKNFTPSAWAQWVEHCQLRSSRRLEGYPEGLWAHAWQLFQNRLPSAEEDRRYLHSRRVRDEFSYSDRFGLPWPQLASTENATTLAQRSIGPTPKPRRSLRPSPRPEMPRIPRTPRKPWWKPWKWSFTGITPAAVTVQVGQLQRFHAIGLDLHNVRWSAPGGDPPSGTGSTFATRWALPGSRELTAGCEGSVHHASAQIVATAVESEVALPAGKLLVPEIFTVSLTPNGNGAVTRHDAESGGDEVCHDSQRPQGTH
ncbi:MAG: glycosyltransferase [Pseudonocardiaceae bacterium]